MINKPWFEVPTNRLSKWSSFKVAIEKSGIKVEISGFSLNGFLILNNPVLYPPQKAVFVFLLYSNAIRNSCFIPFDLKLRVLTRVSVYKVS
jgi:hypothetical protein